MYKLVFYKRVHGFIYPGQNRESIDAVLVNGQKVKVEGFIEENNGKFDIDRRNGSECVGVVKEIYVDEYEKAMGYFLLFGVSINLNRV